MSLKPNQITKVLDLSLELREKGLVFTPLFAGDAGIGKSEICQQWVKQQQAKDPDFWFYDLRLAYLDAPDLIGLTKIVERDGEQRTNNILPDFWPQGKNTKGLLLIEEPNRAQSDILNALMQLLTDRRVHNYKLPDGIVIAGCINPDNGNYDVASMDQALKNRFEIFEVRYDKKDHMKFMKEHSYDSNIINFVESDNWVFTPIESLGAQGQYISPRTWHKVNSALTSKKVTDDTDIMFATLNASLGKAVGSSFHKFINEARPLVAKDFKGKKKEASLKKLAEYANPEAYRGDMLGITVDSVAGEYKKSIDDDTIVAIASLLPGDLATGLLTKCRGAWVTGHANGTIKEPVMKFDEWLNQYPEFRDSLKTRLKGTFSKDEKENKEATKSK